ncbi:hypothetical protein K9N68_06995 [Kovacikia minuta CCNUW1]|uniref:hypothetical protein n=1 Tax=Kovacikia minuta TaxID=2931930 RepID=UPI001CCCC27B|nr:hypothetical protein [Kovacikia minuta]UBF27659.1 hypothetical protein K9N68_06995 [Kovacikia minuta CCNUW1]
MTSSQSGPYQSKVLSYAVRQTQRWIDRGKVALRQLKVTANWTAQVLLYPIYVVFQTARLAGAHFQQAMELGESVLRSTTKSPEAEPVPTPNVLPTADTPIQQALLTVQNFSLPINLPVEVEPTFLVQTCVRGVATRLETQSLVLVTSQNQILDILTPTQQKQLHQRIEWEITHYVRYWRFRQSARQALLRLSPLATESQKLPPIRAVQQFVSAQLQAEPLQQLGVQLKREILPKLREFGKATIAFGEAMRERLLPSTPVLLPTPDIQIRQILGQAKILSTQRSALSAQHSIQNSKFSPTPHTPHPTPHTPHPTPHSIHGIATLLETKSLVLVTNQNQILDILTVEQREQLRQRIIWEVANYGRQQRIQKMTGRIFSRLRPTPEDGNVLLPVRLFQHLMAWMQTKPIAIATNLFQESSLNFVSEVPSLPLLPEISRIQAFFSRNFSLPVLNPEIGADPTSPLPFQNSLPPSFEIFGEALALPINSLPAPPVSYSPAAAYRFPANGLEQNGLASEAEKAPEKRFWDFIETQATFMGYVLSPPEKLLRWLDSILLSLEESWVGVGKRIPKPNSIFLQLKEWLTRILQPLLLGDREGGYYSRITGFLTLLKQSFQTVLSKFFIKNV